MENKIEYAIFGRTHVVKSKLNVPTTDLSHLKIERVECANVNDSMRKTERDRERWSVKIKRSTHRCHTGKLLSFLGSIRYMSIKNLVIMEKCVRARVCVCARNNFNNNNFTRISDKYTYTAAPFPPLPCQ